ncbi:MAG: ABC transporter permease [Proteobacteria bacterium]|nr:MAG: ABC transporter permease [Pseudomonadota bacterium]QKK10751.1 MAG: ABC transporter permease [Pseudomonadota bacterium]
MIRRFLAVLHARNLEFVRDRSSLAWNLAMPIMLVAGMAWIFADGGRPLFQVGILSEAEQVEVAAHRFLETEHIHFFTVADERDAVRKVERHQIDMLLRLEHDPTYWVNTDSPKGYILEKMLLGSTGPPLARATVSGEAVRYIDWLLPGVLGMNIMFSSLFGVGYVVVRYRKNGFLKRLNATPLRPVEFLLAQILSRLIINLITATILYIGVSLALDIRMEGSYLQLYVIAILGTFSMIALGLVIASRTTSEELAGGLLNVLTWPMMVLSGVWFSLEGSGELLQAVARLLPLTHMLEAARATMLDGAGWSEVSGNLLVLAVMSVAFMAVGAYTFRWKGD